MRVPGRRSPVGKALASTLLFWPSAIQKPQDHRSSDRDRRVRLSAGAGAVARGIGFLTSLAIVPIALRHLGAERFGMWATLASLAGLLSFADLGLGNGLVNATSEANARNDEDSARQFVSSAFYSLLTVAAVIGIGFLLVYSRVPWADLFNVDTGRATREAGPATAVFIGCFLVALPFGIAQRVHMGYQEGYIPSLWTAFGALVSLFLVYLLPVFRSGLPWFVLAMAGGPALAALLNHVILFGRIRPYLTPKLSRVKPQATKSLAQYGALFLGLGLAGALGSQSDNIVIARLLGAESVTLYAVPQRLFLLGPTLLGLVLIPMWPAYREAITVGDVAWVEKAFGRSVVLGFTINAPLAFGFTLWGPKIVEVWTQGVVAPPRSLFLGLALWALQSSFLGPTAMLFNGANVIRFQLVWAMAMAVSNICLSVVLVKTIGVSGAIFGTVVAQLFFLMLPYGLRTRKLFADLQDAANEGKS